MDEKVYQGYLYDFYGELLKESRRSILEDYLFSDLSVTEIASDRNITRQAAFDMIKRSIASLEGYEAKLALLGKFLSAKKNIERIESIAEQNSLTLSDRDEIRRLAHGILEDF